MRGSVGVLLCGGLMCGGLGREGGEVWVERGEGGEWVEEGSLVE